MYPRLASNSYVEKEKLELLISFPSPKSWFISGIVNNKCHFEPSGCTSGELGITWRLEQVTANCSAAKDPTLFSVWPLEAKQVCW